jgi:hypothetical protein
MNVHGTLFTIYDLQCCVALRSCFHVASYTFCDENMSACVFSDKNVSVCVTLSYVFHAASWISYIVGFINISLIIGKWCLHWSLQVCLHSGIALSIFFLQISVCLFTNKPFWCENKHCCLFLLTCYQNWLCYIILCIAVLCGISSWFHVASWHICVSVCDVSFMFYIASCPSQVDHLAHIINVALIFFSSKLVLSGTLSQLVHCSVVWYEFMIPCCVLTHIIMCQCVWC